MSESIELTPKHCGSYAKHEPHWWRVEFMGPRFQCNGAKPKYEYQAAIRYTDGVTLERVGVSFNDEDYADARQRAEGEVWECRRSWAEAPEIVLVCRSIGEWEVAPDGE